MYYLYFNYRYSLEQVKLKIYFIEINLTQIKIFNRVKFLKKMNYFNLIYFKLFFRIIIINKK